MKVNVNFLARWLVILCSAKGITMMHLLKITPTVYTLV